MQKLEVVREINEMGLKPHTVFGEKKSLLSLNRHKIQSHICTLGHMISSQSTIRQHIKHICFRIVMRKAVSLP